MFARMFSFIPLGLHQKVKKPRRRISGPRLVSSPAPTAARCWGWSSFSDGPLVWSVTLVLLLATPSKQQR